MSTNTRTRQLPVGVERVLYAAATDTRFRAELLRDRVAAPARLGLELQPSERTLLASIPETQLLAAIAAMDTSPQNLRRRRFLRTVAAATAGVAVVQGLACATEATGIRPDLPDAGPEDAAEETAPFADGLPTPTGIRPG